MREILFGLVLLFPATRQDESPDLSPRSWPKEDLERYASLNSKLPYRHAPAESDRAMIVGTTGALAIHAGRETLRRGGSVVDAAIATALAQIVLSGGSWNSFAGIFYMVHYEATSGRVSALNAGWNTVLDENDPRSIPPIGKADGRSVLVPGFFAGLEAAHGKFGRLPFKTLFDPALYFAEEGFVVDDVLSWLIARRKDVLSRRPETRAVFAKDGGVLVTKGDVLRQPKLAETLRAVASRGAAYVTTGAWAKKFVEVVRAEGGKMTLKDLERYRPLWSDGLRTKYHGFDLCTLGLPEVGAVELLEALNLAETADAKGMGHYTKSDEALYWFIQVCRLGRVITHSKAYKPGLGAQPNLPHLDPLARIGKESAERNWARIQKRGWEEQVWREFGGHSDGIVAVDERGNVAAVVHTSNTDAWGTTGIFVDGVSVPDPASFQQAMIERVGPGVPLPNITNPVVVLKDGKPVLAACTIGSALHEGMLQNLVNVLDFGMDPQTAVDTPNFWMPDFDPKDAQGWRRQRIDAQGFSDGLLAAAEKRGQPLRRHSTPSDEANVGFWIGVQIDRTARGKLRGGISHRLTGLAEGY